MLKTPAMEKTPGADNMPIIHLVINEKLSRKKKKACSEVFVIANKMKPSVDWKSE